MWSSPRTNWMLELLEVLIFLGGLSQPGWQINRSKCQSYINSNHAQQRWKDKKINISIFQKKIYVADWKFEEYFKHLGFQAVTFLTNRMITNFSIQRHKIQLFDEIESRSSNRLPAKTTGHSKHSSQSISYTIL